MKKLAFIFAILSLVSFTSCTKHVIEYETHDVVNKAEVRMMYVTPVSGATFSVKQLSYNDVVYSNVITAVGTGWPNSSGKFHVVEPGANKVKMTYDDKVLYEGSATFNAGKQTAFVYNANEAPLVLPEFNGTETSYPKLDPWKDTVCHVNIVNVFHKPDGVTPYGKVQLYIRRGSGTLTKPYVYDKIGNPIGYKENTGWVPVRLQPTSISGAETVTAVLRNVDASGAETDFMYYNSSNKVVLWTASLGFTKARCWWMILRGKEGTNYNSQILSLNTFAAL